MVQKAVRIMKLTALLILVASLHVNATGYGQKVTLSERDVSVEKIFTEIRKQTGYTFFYSSYILENKQKVTVTVNNASVREVLDICLKDQGLDYKINEADKLIIIKPRQVQKGKVEVIQADPIDLRGKVVDENGKPVPGVTVTVKGTKKQTITDDKGEFSFSDVDVNSVLSFSSVNMEPFTVNVGGKTEILAKLKTKTSELDEVQIIAYGTTTKRFSTGNIATVKASDIEKQPVNNPLLALQGRVPGLFITQANGLPGSGVTVRIQGQNSIRSGNDPLYVVDGVPYTSQNLYTGLGGILGGSGGPNINGIPSGNGNPLSFINPLDIDRIDILKDADATAIYGSRAANGAVLITTKKGKAGKTRVDFNLQTGFGKVARSLDLLDTDQYIQMRREAKSNDNAAILATDFDINGKWDTTSYTDWQKALIGGTSRYTDIQGTTSGGNANIQFLIGGGYHKETTVFPGNMSDQKSSLHFKINNKSDNQKFQVQLSANYLNDNNQIIGEDLTNRAITLAPNAPPIYNSDGTLNWEQTNTGTSTWNNPLALLYNTYQNKTNNLISNAEVSYHVLPVLEVKTNLGYTSLKTREVTTLSSLYTRPENRNNTPRTATYSNSTLESWLIEPQAVLKQNIYKGILEVLLGMTIQNNNNYVLAVSGSGYTSDLVLRDLNAAASISKYASLASEYKYNALFGRVNYNFNEKYIVNFNIRRDGSTRFGANNRFHNFGSIGGAWIFSKERAIQKGLPFISFGKLNGSYGTTGNDQIGDYQFLSRYDPSPSAPYQSITGLNVNNLTNPYLEWEENKKLQFGLALGILGDRILFNMNYYRNRSSNQLLPYDLPFVTGFGSIMRNFPATVQNSGYEISLNAVLFKSGTFNWVSDINLTINKNKLIEFPDLATSSYSNSLIIGQPITIRKVYHFLGVNPSTGAYQFADKDGNATSTPNALTDQTILINSLPKIFGGFQNSLSFGGFELSFLFQFVKQKALNYFAGNLSGGRFNVNQPTDVLSRWQKPGDITTIQRYNSNFSLVQSSVAALLQSDQAWSDASYVRLKNLSVSWRLPEKWREKIRFQNCRFYFHGQNLLTVTDYKGLDPENTSTSSLPPLRVLTLGLQISL